MVKQQGLGHLQPSLTLCRGARVLPVSGQKTHGLQDLGLCGAVSVSVGQTLQGSVRCFWSSRWRFSYPTVPSRALHCHISSLSRRLCSVFVHGR